MEYIEDSMHELKESVNNDIPKVASAFANTEGGEILIGFKNDGSVIGIDRSQADLMQRHIEEYIKEINPVPRHLISFKDMGGKSVFVVRIEQIYDGFCTYKGVFYYRHGSITNRLEGIELKDFLTSRNMIFFDRQPLLNTTIDDVDENKLKTFLQIRTPNFKYNSIEDAIANLGLFVNSGKKDRLNNAAILFFGKDPWQFFKQSEIRIASFSDLDASSEVLNRKDIHFTIPENIEEAEKFIKANTKATYEIHDLKRVEVPEYPNRVIREVLVNALAHRDYFSADAVQIHIFTNRIEFINPGILPGGISLEELGKISVRRNPLIYQLMRDMKYMEGLATGIPMMKEEMRKVKLQGPEFRIIGSFFSTTLYNKLGKKLDFNILNPRQKRALEVIRSKGSITSAEYVELNGVASPTAVSDLSKMVKERILRKIGITKGAYYIGAGQQGVPNISNY